MHGVELRIRLWVGNLCQMLLMIPVRDIYDISDLGDWVYFPRAEHLVKELRAAFREKRTWPDKGIRKGADIVHHDYGTLLRSSSQQKYGRKWHRGKDRGPWSRMRDQMDKEYPR